MTRSKLTHVEIGPGMTQEQAETLYARGKDVAVFVMMVLAKKLAVETATSTDAPSTPSSAKPPYEKENKQADKQGQKKSGKKPGAKPGHSGKHREQPEQIDRHEQLRAKECPDCGNKRLRRCKKKRKGADTQAILMTVFRTLNGRNLNPVDTVVQALRQYNLTGNLPPLPKKT